LRTIPSHFGRVIKQALEAVADIKACGLCRNAQAAIQRARTDSTDLVALDVELAPTNCLEVLQAMRQEGMGVAAILVGESNDRSGLHTR
jgi:response regulator of citrate/malate metabolism